MSGLRKHRRILLVLSPVFAAGVLLDVGNLVAVQKVSKRALKEMIASAKTAADHKAIADYYHSEAVKARAKADEPEQEAALYRRVGEATPMRRELSRTVRHWSKITGPRPIISQLWPKNMKAWQPRWGHQRHGSWIYNLVRSECPTSKDRDSKQPTGYSLNRDGQFIPVEFVLQPMH